MSYGPSIPDLVKRSAAFIDKILKARIRRPADRAAHKVRARHQHEDRQGARPDDPEPLLVRAEELIQ